MIHKDLHLDLRARTQDVHERLHVHPLLKRLTSATLCQDDYLLILNAFYGFYSMWEPRFKAFRFNFLHEIDPLALLEKDFSALQEAHPLHIADVMMGPVNFSDYIGYLYVKQGSTLGGQFISAHIQKTLGLEKGKNLHYFNGFGAQTGNKWKAFKLFLKDQEPLLDRTRVMETATQTFLSMETYFHEYNSLVRTHAA